MSDLEKKLKKIISDLEKNLNNQDDLEYVKNQIYEIYNIFIEKFEKLEEKSNEKIESIFIRYKVLEDRISEIENSIDKIESDIYIKENEEYDFDITCPYCDTEFSVDFSDGTRDSVICPECNNSIELDWNNNEGCSHDCHDCHGECSKDANENNEDDM